MNKYFVLVPDIAVRIPDIIVPIPDIIVHIPDITVLISNIKFMRKLMSGIWPVKTVHIPDIKNRYPGNGQFFTGRNPDIIF